MKTAKEKAEYWLNHNMDYWCKDELDSLITLLKEQDRDTRHACAEACLTATQNENLHIVSKAYHDICMNTKAV